ncbi:MAG TPA: beta-propeller fold lactonase family protein [Terracidiphilus sp.]
MKFTKSDQHNPATGFSRWRGLLLVSAASLGVASVLTACEQVSGTLTADFVYVTSALAAGSNQYGQIDVFEVNAQSGRMRQIPTSPFPSGGRNPVAEAVNPDNSTLYVVNRDDNTIVQFAIGSDGKLYPQNTVNTPGIFPVATAVSGGNLFVADTYEPLPTCSPAAPCTGSVAGWPLKNDALDSENQFVSANNSHYWPLTIPGATTSDIIAPVGIAATGSNIYVAAYDSTANTGYVFGFAVGSSSLTPLNGGVPTPAGIHPSAIVADPSGAYVYVTDSSRGDVLGFTISGSALTQIGGSPFASGNSPSAMVIDSTGKLAYVANAVDSTIQGYEIGSGGALTSFATFATDTQPVAIGIDPNLNQYLYTANFLANTVSGFRIDSTTGSLVNSQFSPSAANANPTAVAAIPHKVTVH